LYVVDVSQPDTLTLVGQTEAGDVGVAHFRDNHLYVTEGDGVSVFDVSIPSNPHRVGHVAIPEGPNRLRQVAGNYLYLSYGSDLRVIDISDPTLPTLVATLPGLNGLVYVDPPHLYVVSNSLTDVDISDPTHPAVLSHTSLGSQVIESAYDARTKYLYIWAWPDFRSPGFTAIDVTNPQQYPPLQEIDWLPTAVSLDNGLLYVIEYVVKVYSLTNPAQPRLIGTESLPIVGFFAATVKSDTVYAIAEDGLYTFRLPHFLPFRSFLPAIEVLKGAAG
jgi:hypothetical protein